MKFRVIGMILLGLSAGLSLSGCGLLDDNIATFDGAQNPPVEAAAASRPPAPVAVAAGPDPWCLAVATGDKNKAAADGFDAATQQRMAVASYTQCVAISGDAR